MRGRLSRNRPCATVAIPAADLPSTARALAFWCAFAAADMNRHGGDREEVELEAAAAARRHTKRGFVSLLGVCGRGLHSSTFRLN